MIYISFKRVILLFIYYGGFPPVIAEKRRRVSVLMDEESPEQKQFYGYIREYTVSWVCVYSK